MFESFSLATSIAGGCAIQNNNQAAGMCAWDYGAYGKVFLIGIQGCEAADATALAVDDLAQNQICYHVPIETLALFNS